MFHCYTVDLIPFIFRGHKTTEFLKQINNLILIVTIFLGLSPLFLIRELELHNFRYIIQFKVQLRCQDHFWSEVYKVEATLAQHMLDLGFQMTSILSNTTKLLKIIRLLFRIIPLTILTYLICRMESLLLVKLHSSIRSFTLITFFRINGAIIPHLLLSLNFNVPPFSLTLILSFIRIKLLFIFLC